MQGNIHHLLRAILLSSDTLQPLRAIDIQQSAAQRGAQLDISQRDAQNRHLDPGIGQPGAQQGRQRV